jgi:hypothetical protein
MRPVPAAAESRLPDPSMKSTEDLREQGVGSTEALLILDVSFADRMEARWLAVEVCPTLVVCSLALVLPMARSVGFRSESEGDARSAGDDYTDITSTTPRKGPQMSRCPRGSRCGSPPHSQRTWASSGGVTWG